MRRTEEFDAFGPWILEVEKPEDVPRLYRGHPLDLGSAEMVLKVPRRISRRDANSDMDLYDHLIVAGSESITVLTRRGDRYETADLPYRRIAAISSSVSLLDGRLVMHDIEGGQPAGVALNVRFNSVSQDLIGRLVTRARSKTLEPGSGRVVPTPPHAVHGPLALRDLGDDDVALVSALREIALLDDRVVPVATHQRTVVQRRSGVLGGLIDRVRPVTLQAAIVCVSPGELHVLHRRQWFTTGRRPIHSVAHTVVVVPLVTAVREEDAKYASARQVRITSGSSVVEVPFPSGSETGVGMLAALGARSR